MLVTIVRLASVAGWAFWVIIANFILGPSFADTPTVSVHDAFSWTAEDIDAFAAAATKVVETSERNDHAGQLVVLAKALISGGHSRNAHEIAIEASHLLPRMNDWAAISLRGSLIDLFGRLGEADQGRSLIPVNAAPQVRMNLLAALGTGEASGAMPDAAEAIARSIASSVIEDDRLDRSLLTPEDGVAAIGAALAKHDPERTLRIADLLRPGYPKLLDLAAAADVVCTSVDANVNASLRSEIVRDVEDIAPIAFKGSLDSGEHDLAPLIGAVLTECSGPDTAKNQVALLERPPSSADTLRSVVSVLIARGNTSSAVRAMMPATTSSSFNTELLDATKWSKLGDLVAATAAATNALRLATSGSDRGEAIDFLIRSGAEDDALSAIQQFPATNSGAEYISIIGREAANHQQEALTKTVALAVAAPAGWESEGESDHSKIYYARDLTKTLLIAGQRDLALQAFDLWMTLSNSQDAEDRSEDLAELQADAGDLKSACESLLSDALRDKTATPTFDLPIALAAIRLDAKSTETLANIVVDLVSEGNLGPALQIEARLNAADGDAFADLRDPALVSISRAEEKAGALAAASAAALRISDRLVQWPLLLELAAVHGGE